MANSRKDPTIVDSLVIEEGNQRTMYVIHDHDKASTTTGSKTTTTTTTGSKRSEFSASTDPTEESEYNRSGEPPPWEKLPFLGNQDLYFTDGKRLIDFILVYDSSSDVPLRLEKEKWRMNFEANLEKIGLQVEMVEGNNLDTICYVKVHTTWKTLKRFAEVMKIRMPIARNNIFANTASVHCQPNWSKKLDYDKELLSDPQKYFTAWFSNARIKRFIVNSKDTFFTPAQRSFITNFILSRTIFEDVGDVSMNKVGIGRLLANNAYISAFPLHSGDFLYSGSTNLRNLLYETWGKPSNFWKCQPCDHIKMYFGTKIAWYFSWLGVYTVCLVPAAFIGLIVFIYGIYLQRYADDEVICDETLVDPGNFIMCPRCDHTCKYTRLKEFCEFSKRHLGLDNILTIPHTMFVVIWGRVFLLVWQRHQNVLKHHWAVHDYEAAEVIRPEYMALKGKRIINPVNNMAEPALPCASKSCRMSFSVSLTLVMLAMVIIALIGVIIYRTATIGIFTGKGTWYPYLGKLSANIINVVCIGTLSNIYKKLAYRMTDFEMPRTQSDWEDSFIIKSFLFNFINHNAAIFYVSFFKGNFIGSPKKYTRSFGTVRLEECDEDGCIYETFHFLFLLTVGQLLWNNVQEIVKTKVSYWWRERKSQKKFVVSKSPWETDYLLAPAHNTDIIDEYLEIVLQFATITIHAAAFPIGALFGLIGNIIEIRVDAYKLVTEFRRPVAFNTQGIDIWVTILQGICYFAVMANSATLAFSSEIIPKTVFHWFEHKQTYGNFYNFSTSIFNVTQFDPKAIPDDMTVTNPLENVTMCRFVDYRFPPGHPQEYEFSDTHFQVLAFRLGFMVIFNLAVGIISWFFTVAVNETPRIVKQQALREIYLAQKDSISDQEPSEAPKDRGETGGMGK